MSNRFKGETTFEHEGVVYTLVYPIDALILLEERFDTPILELGLAFGDGMRMSMLKFMFWAGLRAYHEDLDLDAAGVLASQLGMPPTAHLVRQAWQGAFVPASEGAKARPRKAAAAGTGKSS